MTLPFLAPHFCRMGVVLPADEAHTTDAIRALKEGHVIAVPTDTLYGFACDASSHAAVNKLREIKGRREANPLAICVGDVSDVNTHAVADHLPHGLLDSLFPGPVTVVLKRAGPSPLENVLNPGFGSVGVRVPDNDFVRAVARGCGRGGAALTSANLSGEPSSVCVRDFENLWGECESVYDGGVLGPGRAGSTVVDLTAQGVYKVLRIGSGYEETKVVLGRYFKGAGEE